MSKMEKIISVVLAIVMSAMVLLTGCGQTASNETKASTQPVESQTSAQGESAQAASDVNWDTKQNRKLVFSTIAEYYTTGLKNAAAEYNKLHPETTVEIEIIPDNEMYKQNFVTKMAADKKTGPDIIHTNLISSDSKASDAVQKGWVLPLDPLLDESNPYNNGQKVRDAIDSTYLSQAVCSTGETSYLPFDLVGVGFYYNKDIFAKLGIQIPKTYDELFSAMDKLKAGGYSNPIGATIFSDWVTHTLADWALRQYTDKVISLPGDGRYDEKTMQVNAESKFDANNSTFDEGVILDPEKFAAFNKSFDRKSSSAVKAIWNTYKNFAEYFQPGWGNPDGEQIYAQFVAQKYPIYISGSWEVGRLISDIKKLPSDKQFQWGTFSYPSISNPGADFPGSIRGLKVAGHLIGLTNKDDEDLTNRAKDFLKYMYSPNAASQIYADTLAAGEKVQGPSLIKGVQMSDEVNSYLDGFNASGSMRMDWVFLIGEQNSMLPTDKPLFLDARYKFVEGKLTIDQFLDTVDKLIQNKIADDAKNNKWDLDPKTKE